MSSREEIIADFYNRYTEDERLSKSRQGQLEYFTTMHYIHRYAAKGARVLEVGAGTGRYSTALAEEGMRVTAVELVKSHFEILQEKSKGLERLQAFRGDAVDLSRFADDTFNLTLVFGPMYHLYEEKEVHRAIDEAIRVTQPGGVMLFAFLSAYAIMYSNYFYNNWAKGQKMNYTDAYAIKHFKEQLFTGYDVSGFEALFQNKPVEWITTVGVDGMLELVEKCPEASISDEDFKAFAQWHLAFAEKRELLGSMNHLLYICRKGPA